MEARFIFKTAAGKRQVLARTLPVTIGRSSTSSLRIPEAKDAVSRRHCDVFLDGEGRVCIQDLGSTNGTFLDGRRLEPEAVTPVKSGASVKLGDVGFRLEYAAAGARASADEPAADELAAGEPVLPATEPLAAHHGVVPAVEPESAVELEADDPTAGDFGFLADEQPAAAGDDKLDDFFKGLS
jgi:predicted component of type VI protein secretion system